MKIVQSGEPVGEVVSLALVKQQCRVDFSDDDDLIQHYIDAAAEWVKDACQTVLLETEFTATGQDFDLAFKGFPNATIVSISYVDPLGAPGVIADFEISDSRLYVPNPPAIASATVTFNAGIGVGNIPKKLVQAVLMLAASFYDQRADFTKDMTSSVPFGVRAMVSHHRSFAFA